MLNVLIIGSGGREHALVWKAAQSARLAHLYCAPGNAGTARLARNLPLTAEDPAGLVKFAQEKEIGLVIIGPEAPLAVGLADTLHAAGLKVFGPSQAAAQLESSKVFAKDFMARHNLPTARYAKFTQFDAALSHLKEVDYPIVIKASGLAAGKGVILPENAAEAEAALRQIMVKRAFGAAGNEVVIEERLTGEEVSLLAFTDGTTVKPMPPAQDHKRLLDGDRGPNTGGMGAYAPAPILPPARVEEYVRTILQPTVDGLRAEGLPYVGVLYAGLMRTPDGPRLLEFNCRFGDPETQVIMPLLNSDLLDIAEACADGRLAEVDVDWQAGAAACVVLASEGYPGKYLSGRAIHGLDAESDNAVVFHAGTKLLDHAVVTAGGRVLCVTGWSDTIAGALKAAYAAIAPIKFEGMQYRKDIGWRATANG